MIEAVTHFLSFGRLLRETNAFFISLIPKNSSPEAFSDFRPISLLNFTYKISSKILASRLSSILPLISHSQTTFVKGRLIHHNVALAHDLIHKLNTKVKGGSVCLKLDISKAFDKLHYNSLFRALKFFNFSSAWINMIGEMICTSRGLVLINNSHSGFFSSSCGLRQGDPLSPYLFILAEEILSLHIEHLGSFVKMVPISPIASTPCHLLYADSILFFL